MANGEPLSHTSGYLQTYPYPSQQQSILDRLAALERAVGIHSPVFTTTWAATNGALAPQPATDQHDSAK
jgi:hypothetical protein